MDGSLLKQIEALRGCAVSRSFGRSIGNCSVRSRALAEPAFPRTAHRLAPAGAAVKVACRSERASAPWKSPTTPMCGCCRRGERRIRSSVCGRAEPVSIAAFPRSGSY